MKRTILAAALAAALAGCAGAPIGGAGEPAAPSTPRYEARGEGGVRIVLHEERCALSAIVGLPRAAVWIEPGKSFVGCWGPRPDLGLVQLYFPGDRSLPLAPMQAFSPLGGS